MEQQRKVYDNMAVRVFLYLLGMVVLALGITLNTKVSLGVSPIISIAYCVSQINGQNFGDMTFLLYAVIVLIEILAHLLTKQYKKIIADALQLIISLIFSRLLNVFGDWIPVFAEDLAGTVWAGLPMRLVFLAAAIVCTGIGAALSLDMRLIPNPGDGVVQTFADITGKGNGFIKNCLDFTCVFITLMIGLIGTHHVIGIGAGTLIAMLGVGRVIWLFNKIFGFEKAKK